MYVWIIYIDSLMEKFFWYVMLVSVISIAVTSFWQLGILRSLASKIDSNPKSLNDQKYFELKYHLQLLTVIFGIIVGLAGLFGYDTYESIERRIVNAVDSRITGLTAKLDSMELTVTRVRSNLPSHAEVALLDQQLKSRRAEIVKINSTIDELRSRNILKQNFYVVEEVIIPWKTYVSVVERKEGENVPYVIRFNELRTNLGDKLPAFHSAPLLIPVNTGKFTVDIRDVTAETFEMHLTNPFYVDLSQRTGLEEIQFSIIVIEY